MGKSSATQLFFAYYDNNTHFYCLYIQKYCRNALDLLPTTVFPNYPPGGHVNDENNQKAIEALKSAKEYIVNEEDLLHQSSILSESWWQLFRNLRFQAATHFARVAAY